MIPIGNNQLRKGTGLVTWTLVALNVVIFLWDRHWNPFAGNTVFGDLVMRPSDVVLAAHRGQDHFALVTIFTSLFLHGNLMHLFGNMIFLLVFGVAVEEAMGSWRYALYYIAWGVVATAAQIFVNPHSDIPTLGASGAIGGVLGAYFLLFPASKIEVVVPLLAFWAFDVAAWIILGLWFLYQIFIPQEGVANWAHAGGFLSGMLTVLVMGGRASILKGRERDFEYDS